MPGTRQRSSPLRATEELVRANFSEEAYANLAGDDGEWKDALASLRKQFVTVVVFARRQFGALKHGLAKWQERVRCGEVDFEQPQEEWFKGELRAFVSLADALDETFDRFHKRGGVFLTKPRPVGELLECKRVAQRLLDTWQRPEWGVTNERTVTWDKEQTRQLRAILASDD